MITKDSNNPEVPEGPAGQVLTRKGHKDIAVISLGQEISEILHKSWLPPDHFQSDGVVVSAWLSPFLGVLDTFGADNTVASSLYSGNVFMATANPQIRMTIGKGGRAAVIGPDGKIVAIAPFVATSTALIPTALIPTALIPVMAPVMLFMTALSMITSAQFGQMEEDLGRMFTTLDRVRCLMKSGDYAKLESIAEHLGAVKGSTDGVKIKLFLAQKNVKVVVSDMLLGLYHTLQDDPSYAERCQADLCGEVEECIRTFRKLESSAAAALREETFVFYHDGQGTLRAYRTRDLRLQPMDGIGSKD